MTATPTPLLPFKECGTPDAIYGALVTARMIKFTVNFPVPLIADKDEQAFIAEMHAAMLPVIERLYERQWRMLAGTKDKEGRSYPATYAELWPSAEIATPTSSPDAVAERPVTGKAIATPSHDDACRLSIMFGRASDLRTAQDIRINEWLKTVISAPRPPLCRDDEDPVEFQALVDKASAETDAELRADVLAEAKAALEPFAAFVTPDPKWLADNAAVSMGSSLARRQLTAGDCRRAARALAKLP